MRNRFTLSLTQQNPVVGDLDGNRRMAEAAVRATGAVDLVVFSELFIAGYPPDDLVLSDAFVADAMAAVEALAAALADGPAVAIGTPWRADGVLTNACAILKGGRVDALRHKVTLGEGPVFDERGVFAAGPMPGPVDIAGVRIGLVIGSDILAEDVAECLTETGADLLVAPGASPHGRNSAEIGLQAALARVVETELPLAVVNPVGGQDAWVFGGASFVLAADRTLAAQLPAFRPAAASVTFVHGAGGWVPQTAARAPQPEGEEADWCAAMLGLADFVDKNGFEGVAVGLSGGTDAAMGLVLAVDALGPQRVRAVLLPEGATADAGLCALAERLGVRCDSQSVAPAIAGFAALLGEAPPALVPRVRGTALMAMAERAGDLALVPASRSAVLLGATAFGAVEGGFNPLRDLYLADIVRLCRWRSRHRPQGALGPDAVVIEGSEADPPAADAIVRRIVEDGAQMADLVAQGAAVATVREIADRLRLAEPRRRQAAPGPTIASPASARVRRHPITNRYCHV